MTSLALIPKAARLTAAQLLAPVFDGPLTIGSTLAV